jgi:predicted ArsR family transcriptional regulator
MGDEAISKDVREFLARYIHSVAQLEVLLTLHSHADQDWDASRLARELAIDGDAATMYLEDLSSRGLLTYDRTGTPTFRYGPTSDLRTTIERLSETYTKRRVAVITLIFSKPVDDVRSFSDAFRLRKDE